MWIDPKNQSYDALKACIDLKKQGKDYSEFEKLITEEDDAYNFCINVEDKIEIRNLLKDYKLRWYLQHFKGVKTIADPEKILLERVAESDDEDLKFIYCLATKCLHKELIDSIKDSVNCAKICIEVENHPTLRNRITNSEGSFLYCKYIKDEERFWSRIRSSQWATDYCLQVNDRPEVRKYINSGARAFEYVKSFWGYKKIDERLFCLIKKNSTACYNFCTEIEDKVEFAKCITVETIKCYYLAFKEGRGEVKRTLSFSSGEEMIW